MSIFINTVKAARRDVELLNSIKNIADSKASSNTFIAKNSDFTNVPGSPFSYWVSGNVRDIYLNFPPLLGESRLAQHGCSTKDDSRYLRLYWELPLTCNNDGWFLFAKGGDYSEFYSDVYLCINWGKDAYELEADLLTKYPYLGNDANWVLHRECHYLKPGLTWSRRTTSGLSMRILPANCFFSDKGPAIFSLEKDDKYLLAIQAVLSSSAYKFLLGMQLAASDTAARSYEIGLLQNTPIPNLEQNDIDYLAEKTTECWRIMKLLDSGNETSHAFVMPDWLLEKTLAIKLSDQVKRFVLLKNEINDYCFKLYGFNENDIAQAEADDHSFKQGVSNEKTLSNSPQLLESTISWLVGVAFGRFNKRVEFDIHEYNEENPLSKLPKYSPGMVSCSGDNNVAILVSDPSDTRDLTRNILKISNELELSFDKNLDKYINQDFFKDHIKKYSKSRRQAPIYWPLQTVSGSYTLWVYYQNLNSQTLYTCVNDFLQPKIKAVIQQVELLKANTNRTNKEEQELSSLCDFEKELLELKETLLDIAKHWKPNLNDGVQITAAPLWRLFKNKAWQKKLKQTWEKLEEGAFDWAHLAFSTWPERVLKKCYEDRSLAIAHDVEVDLWHEVEVIKDKKKEPVWEWQPKPLSDGELHSYIKEKIATDERLKLYRSNQSADTNGGVL